MYDRGVRRPNVWENPPQENLLGSAQVRCTVSEDAGKTP